MAVVFRKRKRVKKHERVGTMIRRIRMRRGETQGELASKLGVTTRTVQGWEEGDHRPGVRTISKLRALLDPTDYEALEETFFPSPD